MISKKNIIQQLKEAGFVKTDSISACMESERRSYFIQVTSRSKQGWKHIFHNPMSGESLEFEMYWMTYTGAGKAYSIKLNEVNERTINSIITKFLR